MTLRYVLIGQTPVPEPDLDKWAEWYESLQNRIVKQEYIGAVMVSTVFLGLNHRFGEGPPLLFETMAFSDGSTIYELGITRCSTWLEAEAQHRATCEKVRAQRRPAKSFRGASPP